ncbi:MAG: AgmX/PglI C-terminal domain-containing protein [Minicystis sp.]
METQSSKRTGIILGAAVLSAVIGVNLFRHRVEAAPPRPRASAHAEAVSAPAPRVPSPAAASAEARRARDAMRAEILEAMRKRAASASPAAPSPAAPRASAKPPEADEPRGHYDVDYIRTHFREDMFPLMRQCYEGALLRRPKLAGKLVLGFDIVGDPDVGGIVEEASFVDGSTIHDEEMETCVRESLMTLTFDKPPTGGGRVTVKYPIEFSPGDDEDQDGGRDERGTGTGERDGGAPSPATKDGGGA